MTMLYANLKQTAINLGKKKKKKKKKKSNYESNVLSFFTDIQHICFTN